MRLMRLSLIALGIVLLAGSPMFADSYTIFNQPTDGVYLASTTNYGGGNGSGSSIASLGTFGFSSMLGLPTLVS